jgi:hypothetical protein
MTAQEQYDNLDSKQRRELLLKIGETPEEAQVLGHRDYVALGGWACLIGTKARCSPDQNFVICEVFLSRR